MPDGSDCSLLNGKIRATRLRYHNEQLVPDLWQIGRRHGCMQTRFTRARSHFRSHKRVRIHFDERKILLNVLREQCPLHELAGIYASGVGDTGGDAHASGPAGNEIGYLLERSSSSLPSSLDSIS